jgi:hypothetical protein
LIIAVVLAVPLWVAGVAAGGDLEAFCRDHPDHAKCQEDPSTTTTTTPEPPLLQPCETVTTLGLTGSLFFECDWTLDNDGSPTGTVTVTVEGGDIDRVVAMVRDSDPGDICVLEQWDKATGSEFIASFPLEYGGATYWQVGEHWCEPFDPVAGQREDLNGDPLHVMLSLRGKKGTEVTVTLSPSQAG